MTFELKDAIGIVVFLFTLFVFLRGEQRARSGVDEGLRQKLTDEVATVYKKLTDEVATVYKKIEERETLLHKRIDLEGSILREKQEILNLKQAILEVQVKPFIDSYAKRVADVFHQPHHSAWRLDRLIEEYQREKDRMPPQRLQHIIDEVWIIYQQAKQDGGEPNPFVFFNARMWLDILDNQRDTWYLVRAHEARIKELEGRQVELEQERQQLDITSIPSTPGEEQEPWWTRWLRWVRKFLRGSN